MSAAESQAETDAPQYASPPFGDGLLGHYYDGLDLTGLREQRTDPQIRFLKEFEPRGSATGAVPSGTALRQDGQWSIRWTGHVRIDRPGTWTFHTEDASAGIRLWINGQAVIDQWQPHQKQKNAVSLELDTGWSPIQLEFGYDRDLLDGASPMIDLLFEGPGQSIITIPETHLSSALLTSQDIGTVRSYGSQLITHKDGTYVIEGSGEDILYRADTFRFSYSNFRGDGSITTRVDSIFETHPHAKGGVMFRATLDRNSANVAIEMQATKGAAFQHRPFAGEMTEVGTLDTSLSLPYWIRLEREGDLFRGYISADGETWELFDTATVKMPDRLLVGLAVTSHNQRELTTVAFNKVQIQSKQPRSESP